MGQGGQKDGDTATVGDLKVCDYRKGTFRVLHARDGERSIFYGELLRCIHL